MIVKKIKHKEHWTRLVPLEHQGILWYVSSFYNIPPEYIEQILGFPLIDEHDDLSAFKYMNIEIEGQGCYLEWREYPHHALSCAVSRSLSDEEQNKVKNDLVELFQLNTDWIQDNLKSFVNPSK